MMRASVLVPDATNRPALTVVRSLGRRGCEVWAGRPAGWSPAAASRYVAGIIRHADPADDPEAFVADVAREARRNRIGAILPAADVATAALLTGRDALPAGVCLVAPPPEALATAHDKAALASLAREVGVTVPAGFPVKGGAPDPLAVEELGYPVVVKPRVSRYRSGGRWRGAAVRVARDPAELSRILDADPALPEIGYLLQRKVPGEGRGVFALARDGEIRALFSHRRLREKPPWGGVSTLCETADPEPSLVDATARLLAALRWSGVAMVEFKWDAATRTGWLMEINGRFWGSMQLAVASGVDFPWLVYRQEVLGEPVSCDGPVRRARLWWLLGDLDHFLIRIARGGLAEIPRAARDLARTRQGRALDLDTLRFDDPVPFLVEAGLRVSGAPRRRKARR